ncbi:MAG TPA: LPXTG cell wall anchor domain-containing protein [Pyrinomonadaceae bacterium]
MKVKHRQQKRRFLYLSATLLVMLLSVLVFAGLGLTQTNDRGIKVRVYAFHRINDKSNPLGNVTVKIGTVTVTTDAATGEAETVVPRGRHNVKAYLQGYVVTDISVYPDAMGGTHGGAPAKSVEGDLEMPFLYNSYDEESKYDSTLFVYLKPGDSQQKKDDKKEIALAAVAEDCKDFDWENTSISFAPPGQTMPDGRKSYPISAFGKTIHFELSKYGLAQNKTELKPGTYDVNIDIPSDVYVPSLPIEEVGEANWRPWAKLSKVEVYRAFPKLELVNTYQGNEMGFAVVKLDASLWEGNSVPYVKVYVEKLCDLPYVTVDLFSGGAEVTRDGEVEAIQAGMRLRRNDKIKTEPGSLVQLKSEGGIYLIKIGGPEKVELSIGSVITGAGRKFIVPYLTSGKVQIERISVPKKRTKEPPPDPNLPPVPEPEGTVPSSETGVSVKTPTATATPKGTNYTVNYDEKTGVTTVGVEEGEVEVTPVNASLKQLTLAANQQVEVTKSSVSAITPYSETGGKTGRILLYVGIGVASLLALAGLLFFFRRQHRRAMQPVSHWPGVNPAGRGAPPVNAAPPAASARAAEQVSKVKE